MAIRYLKNIIYLGVIYSGHLKVKKKTKAPISLSLFGLIRYKNNSYVRNLKDKKFEMEYYYFINEAIIS